MRPRSKQGRMQMYHHQSRKLLFSHFFVFYLLHLALFLFFVLTLVDVVNILGAASSAVVLCAELAFFGKPQQSFDPLFRSSLTE